MNMIVVIAPLHVRPELLDRAGDDRAAPDDRIGLVLQQQVHAHGLDAGFADHRVDGGVRSLGALVQAEHAGIEGPVTSASSTAVL